MDRRIGEGLGGMPGMSGDGGTPDGIYLDRGGDDGKRRGGAIRNTFGGVSKNTKT